MLKLEVSFCANDEFKVFTKFGSPELVNSPLISETVYEHENIFLERVVAADLDDITTEDIVSAVLGSFSQSEGTVRWTPLLLTERQIGALGLNIDTKKSTGSPQPHETVTTLPFGLMDNAAHFYDFLMNAPTPFVMLRGPEHVFTFINPAYVQLLGRTSGDQLLGLPVREALPDTGFEVCLSVLQKAYDTGTPQVRRELLNSFRQEDTGLLVDAYFDIVYHPVRDVAGTVVGIMAQATDVTERVLSRQVSENREQKLYRLWVELENIYAAAPVGIAVMDATDFRLLRMNARQAEYWGGTAESLAGTLLHDLPGISAEFLRLVSRAAQGEKLLDVRLQAGSDVDANDWLVSLIPSLDPAGQVETITLISQGAASPGTVALELETVSAGGR